MASPDTNNKDPFFGLPWPIRAIALVGLPAVLTIWLLFIGTGEVRTEIKSSLAASRQNSIYLEKLMQNEIGLQLTLKQLIHLQRITCVSLAKNNETATKCLE